ncbi:MAG: histidine kinase [Candidatus Dormibacteria bacterium]
MSTAGRGPEPLPWRPLRRPLAAFARRWNALSIRRRLLVSMLAVALIPLTLFSLAGVVAIAQVNGGALTRADQQLVHNQSLHLEDLVQSKATVVNDELIAIQDQIGFLALEANDTLANPTRSAPAISGAPVNAVILGPGAGSSQPSPQVLALRSLEVVASSVAQLHPEIAEVWLQLPTVGLLEVSPSSAVTSADRSRFVQLLPSQAEYQLGVQQEQAASAIGQWRQLIAPSPQAAYWTPVYSNPMAGGQAVTVAAEGVNAAGVSYRVGANITVRSLVANFLAGPPGSSHGSYAFLISSNGQVISVGRGGTAALGLGSKGSRAEPVSLTAKHNPWLAVGKAMTLGQQGQRRITLDGSPVEVYYSPLPASRWSLGVAIPVSGLDGSVVGLSQEIGQGLTGVTALLLPILLVLALLAVAFTNVLAGRLVEPLRRLTRASERMSAGDLHTVIPVTAGTVDEVGILERTLEEMRTRLVAQRRQIEDARHQLEHKVQERTEELTLRNQELSTLNSVTGEMGRSLVVADVAATAVAELSQVWPLEEVAVFLADGMGRSGVRLVGRSGGAGDAGSEEALSGAMVQLAGDPLAGPRQSDGLLVIPLITAASLVGYLALRRQAPFDSRQLELLAVMGGQLALALRNAQLFADTQELATINERNRLAREIHDTLAQGLAGIVVQLQAADAWLGRDPSRAREAVDHATELARSSLQEARRSVWDLRPEGLERAGLAGAVRDELSRVGERTGTRTAVRIRGLRGLTMPAGVEVAVFRVIQEAVANSLHHGAPDLVRVEMVRSEGQLRVTVTDDGLGFEPSGAQRSGSFGITSMRERAVACGGTLELDSRPGGGTKVVLRVPCPAPRVQAALP